jgi:hypothetical protein
MTLGSPILMARLPNSSQPTNLAALSLSVDVSRGYRGYVKDEGRRAGLLDPCLSDQFRPGDRWHADRVRADADAGRRGMTNASAGVTDRLRADCSHPTGKRRV